MGTTEIVIAVITSMLGSGGIAAVITAILSSKKFKVELKALEQKTLQDGKEAELNISQKLQKQIMDLSEAHRKESETLRQQNTVLQSKINELNEEIQKLMKWVVYDNAKYRAWLETELVKLNPDIDFPHCNPAPIFSNDEITIDAIENGDSH